MTVNLEREFEYYLQNQKELVQKYKGKVLVIKEQTVIGVFASELEAIQQTSEKHELGTFLMQKCDPTPESHTQSYQSRVTFS